MYWNVRNNRKNINFNHILHWCSWSSWWFSESERHARLACCKETAWYRQMYRPQVLYQQKNHMTKAPPTNFSTDKIPDDTIYLYRHFIILHFYNFRNQMYVTLESWKSASEMRNHTIYIPYHIIIFIIPYHIYHTIYTIPIPHHTIPYQSPMYILIIHLIRII